MKMSHHTHIGSLWHSPRKMVCHHCWLPGRRRLQAMATLGNLQKGQWEENSWKCVQSFHWNSRSLDILLEPHQWDVQWHQTGRTRNHQPARPTYQDLSWEMWLHITGRENQTLTRATLPCNETLRSQKVGQITDCTEQKSHIWQTTPTC